MTFSSSLNLIFSARQVVPLAMSLSVPLLLSLVCLDSAGKMPTEAVIIKRFHVPEYVQVFRNSSGISTKGEWNQNVEKSQFWN